MHDQRGAALLTVLLFAVLMLILITTMLTVTGNEVLIASLHRDGVLALESAEAAAVETVRRIEAGRPYVQGFAGSISPGVDVRVIRREVGTNSAYQEIQVSATVRSVTRRISLLVLQRMRTFPPNLVRAYSITRDGSAQLNGDAYAQAFVDLGPQSQQSTGLTYAGWWIESGAGQSRKRCYSPRDPDCRSRRWYPATRWAVSDISSLGMEIMEQTHRCPEGGAELLPSDTIAGVMAEDPCAEAQCRPVIVSVYGFDRDVVEGEPAAVTDTQPCGLPYKYVAVEFPDTQNPQQTHPRLVKVIVFAQWFDTYWEFDEPQLTYAKKPALEKHPELGAIPPFPEFHEIADNYDRAAHEGLITGGDFGCRLPEMAGDMACPEDVGRPLLVFLDDDSAHIASTLRGYGTLAARGNLTITSNFEYWGMALVNGLLTGAGTPTIHGTLVVNGPLLITGNFTFEAGGPSVPVGRSVALRRAWWER
ncbi:MAG: hypothetical protein E6H05_04720 [Bacillati bacterium ANGP1]|uniref:Type 4 fimbrial biogenesis protein PilX N-terminal domain-containing protein n=1 Tax=Candidatus Segetimicrobium genomatis TaxID=2569760 RepID=A0A537IXJ3_9BACT|nr:MAG: hypothetical protein E6H05_04720 [Terrabacteria group bacterium ANGP1]